MGFFAVSPKNECPHCIPGKFILSVTEFSDVNVNTPCVDCGNQKENWVCLLCKTVGCSRYVKSHMKEHN